MIEENSRTPIYYIYLITNILNGKNYVGKRKCPKFLNPWNDTKYMGSGVHLIRSQKKYGLKNFTKEILAICSSEKENCILETQYIFLYREIGKAEYNVAPGGDGGYIGGPYSDEMRQKLHDFRLNQVFTPEQEEKRKEGCREFWNSERSETLKRINSERMKGVRNTMGKHWYHRGTENVLAFECPPGFEPGKYTTYKPSEETKRKHSSWIKSLTPEELAAYKAKLSESHKGTVFTEERCRHISEAKKGKPGRKQSEEVRRKISETFRKKREMKNLENKKVDA